jgi:hypothetical protein
MQKNEGRFWTWFCQVSGNESVKKLAVTEGVYDGSRSISPLA